MCRDLEVDFATGSGGGVIIFGVGRVSFIIGRREGGNVGDGRLVVEEGCEGG